MSVWNTKLTTRAVAHDVLTLVLACAVVFGVGVIGYQIGKEVERFVLVRRGMCHLPSKFYPTAQRRGNHTISLRQAEPLDVRL